MLNYYAVAFIVVHFALVDPCVENCWVNTQIAGLIYGMLIVIHTPPDTCYNEMMIKVINVPPEQFCK